MVPIQQSIPDVVSTLLRRQPLTPAKVTFAWRVAVGPGIDRASQVTLDEHGVLRVIVGDAHWRREIEHSLGLVSERLARLLGSHVVRRIEVRRSGPRTRKSTPCP
jgi:hypothetical protein